VVATREQRTGNYEEKMNMINPELVALVEARREAFEKEVRLQRQLAQLPQRPSRLRKWTSGGLLWAGANLVQWGQGLMAEECARGIESAG
jgi:hypothetical protein